jgi:hypothetical protein
MQDTIRARVFISCGQQKGSDEVQVSHSIAGKLEKMGFDPYIAVEEQSLAGVKENILRRLSESEYLIFIDFRRERLFREENGTFVDTDKHRGSLFSHQELAIATYLDIKCLAFREKDVKEDDGILKFIQANCIEFSDRHLLADVVAQKVSEKVSKHEWDPNWRNELMLSRDNTKEFEHVDYVSRQQAPARFYHIRVENLHRRKIAHDCAVYLEKIEDLSSGNVVIPELVEFKWKGVTTSRVSIPPKNSRYFDAFYIYETMPKTVALGINSFIIDFSGYHALYTLRNPSDCQLTYVVFSENFPPVRGTFKLHMGDWLDDIELYPVDQHGGMT